MREEQILKLIGEGKKQGEIAEIMRVTQPTISKWIKQIDIEKVEKARQEAKIAKEEQILELLREGKSQREIAEIMGVSEDTIYKWIKQIDTEKVAKARKEAKVAKEEQILKLIGEGKLPEEIANIMEVSDTTIYRWIKKIDTDKVEKEKQEGKGKREEKVAKARKEAKAAKQESKGKREKVAKARQEAKIAKEEQILELLREGKKQIEIAEIMEVSEQTMSRWIKQIDTEKVKEAKQEGKMQVEIGTKTLVKPQNVTYEQIKQKLKNHTITRAEIDSYRIYLDYKYDKTTAKEVILMANMYIKTKRTSEAISFLNNLIGNEDMEYLGKEKLIAALNEIKRIKKVQDARTLLKQNSTMETSEIAAITGLNEIEVIKIKNQIQGDIEK